MNDTARKILLAELYKLSPPAQEAVRELLTAEQCLAALPEIPQSSKGADVNLIAKLNRAINVLRNSPR